MVSFHLVQGNIMWMCFVSARMGTMSMYICVWVCVLRLNVRKHRRLPTMCFVSCQIAKATLHISHLNIYTWLIEYRQMFIIFDMSREIHVQSHHRSLIILHKHACKVESLSSNGIAQWYDTKQQLILMPHAYFGKH